MLRASSEVFLSDSFSGVVVYEWGGETADNGLRVKRFD